MIQLVCSCSDNTFPEASVLNTSHPRNLRSFLKWEKQIDKTKLMFQKQFFLLLEIRSTVNT